MDVATCALRPPDDDAAAAALPPLIPASFTQLTTPQHHGSPPAADPEDGIPPSWASDLAEWGDVSQSVAAAALLATRSKHPHMASMFRATSEYPGSFHDAVRSAALIELEPSSGPYGHLTLLDRAGVQTTRGSSLAYLLIAAVREAGLTCWTEDSLHPGVGGQTWSAACAFAHQVSE